jgi:hypothetical protein
LRRRKQPDWTDQLILDKDDKIVANLANLTLMLTEAPKWKSVLAYDEFNALQRREFISLLGGASAWPPRAQQAERMRRIGVLQGLAADDPEGQARFEAFRQALGQLGWSDGRNIQIVHRFMDGESDRARAYAAELVALAPNLILTSGASTLGTMLQT